MADTLNIDFDPLTGENLSGWPAVEQNIREGILTPYGSRVMREYFGTLVPDSLGRRVSEATVLGITASVAAFLDAFEPRFRLTLARPVEATRLGEVRIELEGEYLPRALMDDDTSEGLRRVVITSAGAAQDGD